jgi:hypothetical protein
MRRLFFVVPVLVMLCALPAQASSSSLSGATPAQILGRTLSDTTAATTADVHLLSSSGGDNITVIGQASTASAWQNVSMPFSGVSGVVVDNNGAVYVRGNTVFLEMEFAATPVGSRDAVKTYANVWLSVPRSNPAYRSLASEMSLRGLVQSSLPVGKLQNHGLTTIKGQSAWRISGTRSDQSVTVYVRAAAPHVLLSSTIAFTTGGGHHASATVTLSNFGTAYHSPTMSKVVSVTTTGLR